MNFRHIKINEKTIGDLVPKSTMAVYVREGVAEEVATGHIKTPMYRIGNIFYSLNAGGSAYEKVQTNGH